MKKKSLKLLSALGMTAVLAGTIAMGLANAYAPENDLMRIKGYSPEVIETANMQRSRQEWRQPPAPTKSPVQQFFHNIYYGNWTGDVDQFGADTLKGD